MERLNTHLSIVYDYSRHLMASDQGSWSCYVRPDVVTLLGPGSRSNDGIMGLVRVVMCYKDEPI